MGLIRGQPVLFIDLQVRDLEMKFESLAVDRNTKCKTGTGSGDSVYAS